ncbi:MAG: cache domain-containing protein [Pseudomonadota bacterium]
MSVKSRFASFPIRYKLFVSFLVFFLPLATMGSTFVYFQMKQAIKSSIESELTNTTESLLKMVQASAVVSVKNYLRAIAEKNLEEVSYLYNRFLKGRITEAEALGRIRELLLSQEIGQTGYIYCINSQGIVVLHPHAGVEGTNVSHYPFVQQQIRLKNGYIEYDWKNPGETSPRPKALYMSYFAPLDWIISVSSYREEFYQLLNIEDFREGILSLRFGNSGYAFVLNSYGVPIIAGKGGPALSAEPEILPHATLMEMVRLKSGRLTVTAVEADNRRREKLVFFRYIPGYQWIVASAVYTDEVYSPLYMVRNIIILALVAALLVASTLTLLISGSITRPLERLTKKFALGADGDFSIRMHHDSADELGKLSSYFNDFMDRLETYQNSLTTEIREREETEQALRESEARFRDLYDKSKREEELYVSLLSASPDAIVVYDLEGRVVYVNPAFTDIFGWTLAALKGERIPFVPDSEREASWAIIQALIDHGTPCSGFESRRLTKDGNLINVSISGARYHDAAGKPAGMLSILRDVSETKKLQAQVQHGQRMESIGTLAGGIAHDFNNLLMGIQGRASLMLSDIGAGHPYEDHLKGIEDYVQTAADLTRQLLGFARGGKYEVTVLAPNVVVEKTAAMFGRTHKEIDIRSDLAADLLCIEADRSQMEQVLLNLFVNAWHAMPDGGELRLTTRNRHLEGEAAAGIGIPPGQYVLIRVGDTGIGMSREIISRIFDPFFTTKERSRGTGLGLSSAYGIVRNHGGMITVESRPGAGAVFDIYLPALDRSAVDAGPQESEALVRGTGTILLVDDEKIILEVGSALLETLGYQVLTASSGRQALDLYVAHSADIRAVILDMIMPEMKGAAVFDALKAIDPKIRVLLSSGYSINGQAQEIMAKGCSGFIQKPFSIHTLSLKLAEILARER